MRSIYLAGDMTITGLERALTRSLAAHARTPGDWRVCDLGFNTWLLDTLNAQSVLYREPPDILVVVLSPRVLQFLPNPLEQVTACLQALARNREGSEVVFTTAVADPIAAQQLPSGIAIQRTALEVNRVLFEWQPAHPWFHLIDMQSFLIQHGVDRVHDPRYEATARMYLAPGGVNLFAELVVRHIAALVSPPKKVLAVDLDNTLWGGVLGEEGLEGIAIGGESVGYAFLGLQRALLALKANGVLLVTCSKNDEADALRVLESHPDILLRPSAFACHRINWKSKAENIREIAQELNLGTDSFVFLDDSPFEREQMRGLLPEVDVIDLPEDPALFARTLAEYPGFDSLRVTEEDRARAELYAAEARRKSMARAAGSLEDFYRSLEMRALISRAGEESFDRVFQLIHKTNQFNLTTRRYTEPELRRLMSASATAVFVLRLADTLGESGLTGVVVVRMQDATWEIENLLLSCRIIGRTVEYALIRWLAHHAGAAGATQILAEFIPTARNTVAAGFLESAGFERDSRSGKWALDLAGCEMRVPRDFVTVVEAEAAWVSTDTSSRG